MSLVNLYDVELTNTTVQVAAENFEKAIERANKEYGFRVMTVSPSKLSKPVVSEKNETLQKMTPAKNDRPAITFRSNMTVLLHDSMGDDSRIRETARVSTQMEDNEKRNLGLTNMLVRERHGSPFEHVVVTFYIETPIFVVRQFQRHRIASFSEESGRYTEMLPVFYLPDENRKLKQSGRPAAYEYHMGDSADYQSVRTKLIGNSTVAYQSYLEMLDSGISREVSRMILPLNTYTRFFVTMNSRSIMNFLSLRQLNPDATFDSNPQAEINDVSNQMYDHLYSIIPNAMDAFKNHGYVAP